MTYFVTFVFCRCNLSHFLPERTIVSYHSKYDLLHLPWQVSIRVLMYNMLPTTQQALLLLHESEDYQFVNVEAGGDVQHFHPRLTSGEHQHLVIVSQSS